MNKKLQGKLKPSNPDQKQPPKPIFFNLSTKKDQDQLSELLDKHPHTSVIDTYETQLKELFILDNPWLNMNPPQLEKEFATFKQKHFSKQQPYEAGNWVYLSWRQTLLHILDDDGFQQVRTGRNRNLITKEEQSKYYNSRIGIAGLSVGNSIALNIVLSGGGKHMKLADLDTLELTNLNRIRSSIAELTNSKVAATARQIYELDPYADLELHPEGLTENNLEEFMNELDVVIDEMDNLGLKIKLRQEAKKRGIPVVMATDNGDGGLVDIERYDQDKTTPPFGNRLNNELMQQATTQELPRPLLAKIITEDIVGADIVTSRMKDSLLGIGTEVPTWPQLGTAALLNGAVVAATVRKIITGEPLINERVILSTESWLTPNYDSPQSINQRKTQTEEFIKKFHAKLAQASK